MENLITELSEEQLIKLAKKDHKLIIELQKQIHTQKAEYYASLKTFYWIISFAWVTIFVLIFIKIQDRFAFFNFLAAVVSLVLILVGGKLYFIDKPAVTRKAIAKSKILDAMEIESVSIKDSRKKKIGITLVIIGCLLYLTILTTILFVN